ncbi:twin-argninine leader-binding protein DmsD [Klebsiella pneumoniae]|uniref:Twin-argninine leader-binding protein DmsD n=1 Tax=Klebsiella pneumoniae TaxID=573 RepID=A0A378B908_KLEPN|nr:twin-argninine leader-binding protein DmsD [Klebsiella pneumoniae]
MRRIAREIAPLVAAFQDGSWQQQWPFPVAALLASGFAASAEETLPEAWQRLFIGPWALPAPPWGSVWLDKESVLFGDSTLALRQWMRENGIALEADGNEPERSFRHRATPGGMVVRNGAGCVVRSAAGLAPAAVVRGVS